MSRVKTGEPFGRRCAGSTVNVILAIGCDQDVANALDAGGVGWAQLPHKCSSAAEEIEAIDVGGDIPVTHKEAMEIGRASCRERV